MQEKENEWQPGQDGIQKDDETEQPQTPSSLLSNVLHRLGLPPEQTQSELSLDDLLLKLRSGTWEERTVALRALGRLEHPVSLDLLSPFLKDADETVRATTLDVLSTMSKQVPLHWLVEALHDTNWHVREAAIFALAKQGARVPIEVLMTALHDKDGSVREAASFALHQSSVDETSLALYGQLREETSMQRELYDPARLNGKNNGHVPETTPDGDWNGAFMEYGNNSTQAHTVSEQVQVYAANHYAPHGAASHEVPPDEYSGIMSSRNEKVTSYRLRSKSHKSWWALAIVVVAFLFLALGRVSTTVVPQISFDANSKGGSSISMPAKLVDFSFNDPAYAAIMQSALSNALHLPPQQIQEQIKQLGSLDAVADQQGVSASQLQIVEMDAFNQIINFAMNTKGIDSQSAKAQLERLNNDSSLREKTVLGMLNVTSTP